MENGKWRMARMANGTQRTNNNHLAAQRFDHRFLSFIWLFFYRFGVESVVPVVVLANALP